jgi:hypothetical protein
VKVKCLGSEEDCCVLVKLYQHSITELSAHDQVLEQELSTRFRDQSSLCAGENLETSEQSTNDSS